MDFPYVISLPVAVLLAMITLMYVFNRAAHRWLNIKLILLMTIIGIWTVSLSNVKQLLWDAPVVWRFLENFLCYLLPVVANSLIAEILEADLRPAINRTVVGYAGLAGVALLLEFTGHDGLLVCRQLLYGSLLCLQALVFHSMWESIRRGNTYAKFALVPMVVMAVLGLLDGVLLYTRFWNWHFYLLPLGIYACTTFVICMVREQIVRERELEAHAEELTAEIAATMARAEMDELTGCRNRGAFEDFIRQKITAGKKFSLIMLDIDFFKKINDNYGHQTGDAALIQLSQIVLKYCSNEFELFRYGGEEFVILSRLPDELTVELFQHIMTDVRAKFVVEGNPVTISAGIASFCKDYDRTIKIADENLYLAKTDGRNKVYMNGEELKY
jgi:diguanylate cyclase (GGDEF)-like protein